MYGGGDVRGAAFASKAPLEHPRKPAFGWLALGRLYEKEAEMPSMRASSPLGFRPLFLRALRAGTAAPCGLPGGCWVVTPAGVRRFAAAKRAGFAPAGAGESFGNGVNQQFPTARGGGRAMHAPTAEDDCWVRYRRGDHWSSASWRKWCWVVHTKKPPLCKGRWPKGPEGLYLPTAHNNYVQPLRFGYASSAPLAQGSLWFAA